MKPKTFRTKAGALISSPTRGILVLWVHIQGTPTSGNSHLGFRVWGLGFRVHGSKSCVLVVGPSKISFSIQASTTKGRTTS